MSITPHKQTARGKWISLEGGEGCGKTTQARKLTEALNAHGISVVVTREPGGTPSAEAIRSLLLQARDESWLPLTELVLMNAARVENVERVIKPALDQGVWVICDRFIDSTVTYQGIARGLGEAVVWQVHHALFGDVLPDLTFFLDLPPAEGLARALERKTVQQQKNLQLPDESRFEQLGEVFHTKVHDGFKALAERFPARYTTIDARTEIDVVHEMMWKTVLERFLLKH